MVIFHCQLSPDGKQFFDDSLPHAEVAPCKLRHIAALRDVYETLGVPMGDLSSEEAMSAIVSTLIALADA